MIEIRQVCKVDVSRGVMFPFMVLHDWELLAGKQIQAFSLELNDGCIIVKPLYEKTQNTTKKV